MASFTESYHVNMMDKASVIGTGGFSTVYRCINKKDNLPYAVKVISLDKIKPTDKPKIEREAAICQLLNNRNIVRLKDVFKEASTYFLVFELVEGGELFDDIVNRQYYNETDASNCVQQIVSAIQACHRLRIVHRDIKPENLLLSTRNADALVKLTDFGLAVQMEQGPAFFGFAGTPGYLAPEVIRREAYGTPVDIWGAGVILYILLVGYPPFWHDNQNELFEQIKRAQIDFPSPEWDSVTPAAKDLIRKMLDPLPEKRLTADQVLQHPWIASRDTVASKMHRQMTIDQLRTFNAKRKLKGAIHAVTAGRLFSALAPTTPTATTPKGSFTNVLAAAAAFGSTPSTPSAAAVPTLPTHTSAGAGAGAGAAGGVNTAISSSIPVSVSGAAAGPGASGPRRIVTQVTQHLSSEGEDVLQANSDLLEAIATKNWDAYSALTDGELTCFEPEAGGCLVVGQDFHKFFFDNGADSKIRVTVVDPRVRVFGDMAIVTYIRINQSCNGPTVSTSRYEETRVWQQRGVSWVNVHFHRSVVK